MTGRRHPRFDPPCAEVFGWDGSPLGAGERLCNEPIIRGAVYTHRYHARTRDLPNGDVQCVVCSARFLDHDSSRPPP